MAVLHGNGNGKIPRDYHGNGNLTKPITMVQKWYMQKSYFYKEILTLTNYLSD